MSYLNNILKIIEAGLNKFVPITLLSNRSLPFHDYETATTTATYKPYIVGENNQTGKGTQHKKFVSKSTLIYSTTAADIKLNSTENVEIDILAETYYEFKSDISAIFYKYSASEGTIYIWTEGVLAQEGRSAE